MKLKSRKFGQLRIDQLVARVVWLKNQYRGIIISQINRWETILKIVRIIWGVYFNDIFGEIGVFIGI